MTASANSNSPSRKSRRDFLQNTGRIAAASAVAASIAGSPKFVHAAEDNTIQIALVGCGGRGTGAAKNALSVPNGPIKLVAMADVFQSRMDSSFGSISTQFPDRADVPKDRQFIGFEAYKQAMDCLRPGDVVLLTTPPAFRWLHFTYAIEKGLNVFMEKPVTVDGPTSKKMFELGELASQKNLKVGVGLMCRHCEARRELFARIQNGEIGDVTMLRAYRMAGPTGSAVSEPKPEGMTDVEYQIKRFHSFLWASGGAVSDFLIHNIDESCWMKNDWPVQAKACGGRHYKLGLSGKEIVDQNFDSYSIEYTFGDGTKLFVNGRTIPGCHNEFASYAHGSKGLGVISSAAHTPAKCRIYKGHNEDPNNLVWAFPQPEPNPYQLEWNHLIEAIRQDQPYNEVERGVKASLVTSMGRMAAHTGQVITYEQMLECEHEFAPELAELTMDGPAPVKLLANGKYPQPNPGITKNREYLG